MRTNLLLICLGLGIFLSWAGGRLAAASNVETMPSWAFEPPICVIVIDGGSDASSNLAYVWNTSNRTVRATVSCYASGFPETQRLPDQVFTLAPGQRAFVGGTVSNGTRYSYYVVGAQ